MKKQFLSGIFVLAALFLFAGCSQELPELEVLFPTAESVNAKISSLGEETASAALVADIIDDYNYLSSANRAKVTDIQKVMDMAVEITGIEDSTIKVMSFNVRSGELEEDRIQRVVENIRRESPDVLGIQEGTDEVCDAILAALGDEYAMLGYKDQTKSEENNSVLYKKSEFDLIEYDILWLWENQEVKGRHPQSAYDRIFVYNILERKSDGTQFVHINTHFDHHFKDTRVYQAEWLIDYVVNNFSSSVPMFFTGDFNGPESEFFYWVITDAGYESANKYGESTWTFNGYSDNWGSIIDYIFVNDGFKVESYKVCDSKMDGEFISDHNAIVAELSIVSTADAVRNTGK